MQPKLPRREVLQLALGFLLALPAQAQTSVSPTHGRTPSAPLLKPDLVLVVDAGGQGDFVDLQTAINAAPNGALLLVKPGTYQAATISSKSLRVEGEIPGMAIMGGPIHIINTSTTHEVSLGGLFFADGFMVDSCQGDVSLTRCSAIDDGVLAGLPPGLTHGDFGLFPNCGIGGSRQVIQSSASVTLVGCSFEGRNGSHTTYDGLPGEHALIVEDSRVDIYGGLLAGGDGSDAPQAHPPTYAGAGGDGVLARGNTARVVLCDVMLSGGTGGLDQQTNFYNGCPGEPSRTFDNALIEHCASDNASFEIDTIARTGTFPFYTISAPPGSDIFLMVAERRGRTEFTADIGVQHLDGILRVHSLGIMPASGVLTRPYPVPAPAWSHAFAHIELQVRAVVANQDRYSEPRSIRVVPPGL